MNTIEVVEVDDTTEQHYNNESVRSFYRKIIAQDKQNIRRFKDMVNRKDLFERGDDGKNRLEQSPLV